MARPRRLFWYLFLPSLAAVAVTAASVGWFAASSLRNAVEDAEALGRLGAPCAAVEEHLRAFRLGIAAAAAATAALGALASFLFARWLSRPIEQLTAAVERFAAGDLRASLPVPHTAEVAALRDALGVMAGQLHARIDAAETLERAQQDFVGNISHELKTPITTISGYVELLLAGALDDRHAAERFLETIRRQSERMNLIFDDLLALSQLERRMGAPGGVLEQTEIADVVADALEATRARAAEAAVRVDGDCPEGLRVRAAPLLLSQAVANLLRNAIAHTAPGGRVRVCVSAAGGDVAITVLDWGEGIAPEHLPRVFERFYRVDPGRSRRLGGSGLGLAIVKHIALAHGGTVSVVSTVGEGSAFTITVPAS